ncbi:hypothetical protein Tco_0539816, partial [Tanacetum coccineum]
MAWCSGDDGGGTAGGDVGDDVNGVEMVVVRGWRRWSRRLAGSRRKLAGAGPKREERE